jgi:PPE-repeat protein
MVLDFAVLPPEINSGLMYSGAGAGPLMAAAGTWNNLAAELSTTASSYQSIITALTTEQWTGVGSAAAATAAQPFISWLSTTAAAAEHAAAQATASAAAYEAAYAATVHPALIAANRTTLASLVATNILGINTPAILATEAHYAEMWVQDATAMYTYAAASAAAGVLQPLTPATPTTNPAAPAVQAAATSQAAAATPVQGLSGIISGLQGAVSGVNSAIQASPFGPIIDDIGQFAAIPIVQNVIYNIGVTVAWNSANIAGVFPVLGHFLAGAPAGITMGTVSDVTPLAGGMSTGTLVSAASAESGLGGAMTAGVGEAGAVGGLSVPASWSAATPATLASSTAPLGGSGWAVPEEGAAGGPVAGMMPAGMGAAAKGAGAYGAGPRYGVRPIVMPKPVGV